MPSEGRGESYNYLTESETCLWSLVSFRLPRRQPSCFRGTSGFRGTSRETDRTHPQTTKGTTGPGNIRPSRTSHVLPTSEWHAACGRSSQRLNSGLRRSGAPARRRAKPRSGQSEHSALSVLERRGGHGSKPRTRSEHPKPH